MNKLTSELRHAHAANENSYDPAWMSEVPDDWSHSILVTSEHPVFNGRFKELRKWHINDVDRRLIDGADCEFNEEQIDDETQSAQNAKAA